MHKTILSMMLMSCLGTIFSSPAYARQDGQLDSLESEGRIRISLSINPSVQISVVNQINIDIRNVNIDTHFSERVCITGQQGTRYTLTASGQSGAFALYGPDDNALPYYVFYDGDFTRNNFDELTANVPSRVYDVLPVARQCSTLDDNFRVTFKSRDLLAVQSGLYTGALTLLVSPL